MPTARRKLFVWSLWLASAAALAGGLVAHWFSAAALGAAGLLTLWLCKGRRRPVDAEPWPVEEAIAEPEPSVAPANPGNVVELVQEMLRQERYALLLRPQLIKNLSPQHLAGARDGLEQGMALVPEGDVSMGGPDDEPGTEAPVVHVAGLFLDRYQVTNRQFRRFVASGGYTQMSIWDPQILAAVLDFVDSTGCPGPRFWKNGKYPSGQDEHPVVGVSWYEAAAYARWAGKRLPTEAEWVKAGSWPVPLSATSHWQRRFPWGDTMDRDRCNLWGSGPGHAVPVTEYASGVSVGGVYQLIGNVWEWTTGNFGAGEWLGRDLSLPTPMKSIRGGAFDTYFESQATCQFQSGENPLARKHNIGFRCALSLCDLASPLLSQPADEGEDEEEPIAAGRVGV